MGQPVVLHLYGKILAPCMQVTLSERHTSLLLYIINYGRKKFYDCGPWHDIWEKIEEPKKRENYIYFLKIKKCSLLLNYINLGVWMRCLDEVPVVGACGRCLG